MFSTLRAKFAFDTDLCSFPLFFSECLKTVPQQILTSDRMHVFFSFLCTFLTYISVRSREHSSDTMRTRKSRRSPSREKDRQERRREKGPDDRRRSSRSRDRRDRRSRSRDKSRRDQERERDKDRERRHRDHESRHGHRDRDRDHERDRRRRRREEDGDDISEDRQKRKRGEESADEASSHPPLRDSPRRSPERVHSRDRYGDRRSRHSRDPRDEFDDLPRFGRDRGSRRDERRSHQADDSHRPKLSPPPPLACVFFLRVVVPRVR
jgi:RNA-binding protein 39